MNKLKVKVGVVFDEEGKKLPKFVQINDDKLIIDKVLCMRKCPSFKLGGVGERYTIRIQEKEYFLFFEDPVWWLTSSNIV